MARTTNASSARAGAAGSSISREQRPRPAIRAGAQPQQAAQRIGDQQIEQREQEGGGQQRRADIDLGALAAEGLARHPGRQVADRLQLG